MRVLNITPKPKLPWKWFTTFGLIYTSCTRGVQQNGAISLVVLQSSEILGLIIFLAIHFLCVSVEYYP